MLRAQVRPAADRTLEELDDGSRGPLAGQGRDVVTGAAGDGRSPPFCHAHSLGTSAVEPSVNRLAGKRRGRAVPPRISGRPEIRFSFSPAKIGSSRGEPPGPS